jgi:hypothetical protein
MNEKETSKAMSRPLKWVYIAVVAVLAFTGFGQMPIMNRYYVTSIPGLGWSGDFYLNLYIHYAAAAALLGLIAYYLISRAAESRLRPRNGPAWVRAMLFGLLIVTGVLLIGRNLAWVAPSPPVVVAALLTHMGSAMVYLILAATWFRLAGRKKDARSRVGAPKTAAG